MALKMKDKWGVVSDESAALMMAVLGDDTGPTGGLDDALKQLELPLLQTNLVKRLLLKLPPRPISAMPTSPYKK